MCSSNKLVYELQSIFSLLRNWTGVKFKTKQNKKKKTLDLEVFAELHYLWEQNQLNMYMLLGLNTT